MNKKTGQLLKVFDFGQDWLDMKIVTPESLELFWQEYSKGDDLHLEHYRWRAYQAFLDRKIEIDEDTAEGLFKLSEQETDLSLRESMQYLLIKRIDCPVKILERASNSSNKSLAEAALKQIKIRL
jgi:hypothetical protein